MAESTPSRFVSSTGGVILDSLHLPAFLTGLLSSAPFFLAYWAFQAFRSRIPGIAFLVVGVLLLLFFSCRFALGGLAGDSLGGLFSDSGWEIRDVAVVFLRYLALLVVWILPFVLLWWLFSPKLPFLASGRVGSRAAEFPALISLYGLSVIVAPSALLTAATAANRLRDVLTRDLWRGLFAGRTGEFFLVLFAAVGAPVTLAFLFTPFLTAAFNQSQALCITLTGLAGIYTLGVSVSLHGRLCGFFARAVMAEAEVPQSEEVEETARPEPVAEKLDLEAELRAAREEFELSPERGISRLEALLETERDPRIGGTLAEWCLKTGRQELALRAARHGITLYVQKGDLKAAVALYRSFGAKVAEANLPVSALVAVGDAFLAEGDTAAASHALGTALLAEPNNLKAFKSLLKVADQFSSKGETVGQAVKIFEFLLQSAPQSPFAEHARNGLELARRKLGKEG